MNNVVVTMNNVITMNDVMIPNGHYEQCTCSINEVSDQGWDQVHVLV